MHILYHINTSSTITFQRTPSSVCTLEQEQSLSLLTWAHLTAQLVQALGAMPEESGNIKKLKNYVWQASTYTRQENADQLGCSSKINNLILGLGLTITISTIGICKVNDFENSTQNEAF